MIPASSHVLAVVAHADDETLGPGGTLAHFASAGCRVVVAIAADCRTVRSRGATPGLLPEALVAAEALGVEPPEFLGFPAMTLDRDPDELRLVRAIEGLLERERPAVVLTHFAWDVNSDHRAVSRAVAVACRPIGPFAPRTVLAFETPSSTEWGLAPFVPTMFYDIETTLDAKLDALACYASELRPFPHPRSAEALRARAAFWGQTAGLQYAEPFILLRHVER